MSTLCAHHKVHKSLSLALPLWHHCHQSGTQNTSISCFATCSYRQLLKSAGQTFKPLLSAAFLLIFTKPVLQNIYIGVRSIFCVFVTKLAGKQRSCKILYDHTCWNAYFAFNYVTKCSTILLLLQWCIRVNIFKYRYYCVVSRYDTTIFMYQIFAQAHVELFL